MSENTEKRLTLSQVAQRWGCNETRAKRRLDQHNCPRNAYGFREPSEALVRDIERKTARRA